LFLPFFPSSIRSSLPFLPYFFFSFHDVKEVLPSTTATIRRTEGRRGGTKRTEGRRERGRESRHHYHGRKYGYLRNVGRKDIKKGMKEGRKEGRTEPKKGRKDGIEERKEGIEERKEGRVEWTESKNGRI
jgi:hypothetical protein